MLLLFSLACGWRILKVNQDEGEQGTLNRERLTEGNNCRKIIFITGRLKTLEEQARSAVLRTLGKG
jgi:hypothetical protein